MERVRQLFSAILGGMMIAMGGTIYLTQSSPVVGSFLFAVGLFTVVAFQLQLYTGKIGYLPFNKPVYLIELAITWIGNLLGTMLVAWMVGHSRTFNDAMAERVAGIALAKLNDNFLSIFLLSVFCGMLMFIAVDCYRNLQGSTLRFIAVYIPVMVFILSGFEHVVANMFYFSLAGSWSMHCLMSVLVMTLGNSVGGMLIPLYLKIFKVRV